MLDALRPKVSMSNYTVSRTGQVNAAGSVTAIFLKKFAGEVLVTFDELNVMMPLHTIRSIQNGSSAQFPVTGRATAAYHTPGTELAGTAISHNEKIISIDGKLIAHTFIADIDEAMSHFDVRGAYARKLAEQLAIKADKQLLQLAVLAARASANITGENGGSQLTNANYRTVGADLAAGLFAANQTFDEKDIPESARYAAVRPAQYYLLAQTTQVLNKDWGGSGAYSEGKVLRVGGLTIVKTNHLPITLIAADTGVNNTYNADFSNTAFVAFQSEAIGTVKLMDLATGMEYSERHQGTLLTAKYAMGHGILRPECAVEGKIA